MKNFLKEFKEFAVRGNVMDLAIGVIIGNAFTAVVNSLVNDIVMPFFALLTGNVRFAELSIVLNPNDGGTITWNYGNFLQMVVNFLLIAFAIFCTIKVMNRFIHKQKVEEAQKEPVLSDETKALNEIIAILKADKAS